jgi:o-succinylbenzoate---CoA ligase
VTTGAGIPGEAYSHAARLGENGRVRPWTAASAARRPDHPFLVMPDRTVTFAEFDHGVRSAIGALEEWGIRPQDRVAVWADNDLDSAVALAAIPRSGAVVVPLNTRLTVSEAADQVEMAGARLAVGPPDMPDLGVAGLESSRLTGPPSPGLDPEPDRVHSIVFTSGSSGIAKGVRLTWGNLEASAAASAVHLRHREDDRWLLPLPLCHVGGLMVLIRSARQGTTVLLEPRFDAARAARLLVEGEATLVSLVAVMLRRVLDAGPGPYRRVRAVLVGGGGAPLELLREAATAGIPVLPTYGMTETASQIATAPLDEGLRPRRRVIPLPGAEVEVRDGRIYVRGPMVSPGYLRGPDRRGDEWFETGDLGEADVEGGFQVLGRADEMIVTGGEKVHPHEVEQVLRGHPGVVEVCVVGVPDPLWGNRVAAVYQGPAGAGELERHTRYRLAGFKVPRTWVRVDELPRLGIGKLDRRAAAGLVEQA